MTQESDSSPVEPAECSRCGRFIRPLTFETLTGPITRWAGFNDDVHPSACPADVPARRYCSPL